MRLLYIFIQLTFISTSLFLPSSIYAQSVHGELAGSKLAKKHLKEGTVYILTHETAGPPQYEYCVRKVTGEKFGFEYYRVPGCVGTLDLKRLEKYNAVVDDYLSKKHGDDWATKLKIELAKAGCH